METNSAMGINNISSNKATSSSAMVDNRRTMATSPKAGTTRATTALGVTVETQAVLEVSTGGKTDPFSWIWLY